MILKWLSVVLLFAGVAGRISAATPNPPTGFCLGSGCAPSAPSLPIQATVTVNTAVLGAALTDKILGVNMEYWYDQSNPGIVPAFATAGIKQIRWPGGSGADQYHWETNSLCGGGYTATTSQFPGSPASGHGNGPFISELVKPAGLDVAVTLNYGSNAACNGPGDPAEAAAWVTASKNNGDYVTHWTVGNEVYGTYEEDLHSVPHDPATYANAVATGYYPAVKAADPNAQVGVVVLPGFKTASGSPWDSTVLSKAKYDFVELHYYAQGGSPPSDSFLINQGAQIMTSEINALKADLAGAGRAGTPIFMGELGSDYNLPGKQGTSITQALYAGQVLGELMNGGIARATWWLGFGGCSQAGDPGSPDFSTSLYGWQTFGGFMLFSDGLPEGGCTSAPPLAAGTLLPTARVYQLFSAVAKTGENALTASVAGDSTDVRAYAATHSGGAAVVLFNINQTKSVTTKISLSGKTSSANVTVATYDKAIYDQSANNIWAGPTSTSLGARALPLTLTLNPWSVNVVTIAP